MTAARDFLTRAGMGDLESSDPVYFAAEAALVVLDRSLDPEHAATRALKLMPKSSTKFERGIAFGLALALATPGEK